MMITDKAQHDPVTEIPLPSAYMLWALQALETIMNPEGVAGLLQEIGLPHLVGNYPPNTMELGDLTFAHYSSITQSLFNNQGRAAKSLAQRIGRFSAQRSIEEQPAIFGLAGKALKMLPLNMQLKMALNNMAGGFRKIYTKSGYELDIAIDEADDRFIYRSGQCPSCAGKRAPAPICWLWVGVFQEGAAWVTGGKKFEVKQTACRATGDPACVWEIAKTPIGAW